MGKAGVKRPESVVWHLGLGTCGTKEIRSDEGAQEPWVAMLELPQQTEYILDLTIER